MAAVSLLLLLALSQFSLAAYRRTVSYEGQVLLRCEGLGRDAIQLLMNDDSLDVWMIGADGSVEFRVSREDLVRLQKRLLSCSVVVSDMEDFVREAEVMAKPGPNAGWFDAYHGYEDIVKWYSDLSEQYPTLSKFVPSIGKSVEDRDMPALHISSDTMGGQQKIYFQCQIHAREWISGATCMYIANYLLENYGKDTQVTGLLDSLEFIFVPLVNPDGYAYTWSTDRLWRKNRRVGKQCDGVDLNRNYPEHWGGSGSSGFECSETYHGPSVASEPETQNTMKYFKANGPIIGAIDWHSYSQLILRPYGWTKDDCSDEVKLRTLGDYLHNEAYAVHGKNYVSQKPHEIKITTGIASDWFYSDDASKGNKGYRAAGFIIELRDTGQYRFRLPPDQIIPTGQEMVPVVIKFAQFLEKNAIPYTPGETSAV